MSAVRRLIRNRLSDAEIIAELDAISRKRELEPDESLVLERSISADLGSKMPHGINRALARRGIKRDMGRWRQ